MTILHSCCCWRSVRKGSYASATYTLVYFALTAGMLGHFLHQERKYLNGETLSPETHSFLERDISSTTVVFNILLISISSGGIVASLLLIVGIYREIRILLLPWIFTVFTNILVELAHCVYLVVSETFFFEPITAILFTLDFFLFCLNIYSLLCVVSQYQEYKAGRGTAEHDQNNRAPSLRLHYVAQPTGTSCLSTIRGGPGISVGTFGGVSNALGPFDDPLVIGYVLPSAPPPYPGLLDDNDNTGNGTYKSAHKRGPSRKHVKFPDEKIVISEPTSNAESNGMVEEIVPLNAPHDGHLLEVNTQRTPDMAPLLIESPEDPKLLSKIDGTSI